MNTRKKQPVLTRQTILEAAGIEFSLHGYSATGLGAIVSRAELTKGALFHHFPDKQSLAVAWVKEVLAASIETLWGSPLEKISSLDGFIGLCRTRCLDLKADDACSALVALTAEAASDQPKLADAVENLFSSWRDTLTTMLERGKSEGWVHRSIKPNVEAAFLVSVFSGFTVTTQCNPDPSARRTCAAALEGYLETLRNH